VLRSVTGLRLSNWTRSCCRQPCVPCHHRHHRGLVPLLLGAALVGVLDEAGVVLFREDGERGQRRRTENKGWAAGRGGGGGEGERCKGRGGLGFGWGGWTTRWDGESCNG
jgi:hypothetical protein